MRIRNLLAFILVLFVTTSSFAQSAKLKGKVMDATGSIMPGVQVKIYQGTKVVQQGLSSDMGEFELAVAPGDYKLEVSAPDFNTYTEMVKVAADSGPLSITMQLATIAQNVEVTETANQISIDSDSSLQTTTLKQDFIDALPDDEDELTAYLTQIAGTRGDAGGGASFIVDGFTGGRVPPKDQIQEIRISNNPYSSEFSGIGFGRTEIITKAGTGDYHGNANFEFRDNRLNARQAFLVSPDGSPQAKPPAQTRNFQSNFSGPIIRNRLSLNLNVRHFYNDNSNIIRAIVPAADGSPTNLSQYLISPNTNKNLNARTQLAINKNNTLYVNFQDQHRQVQDQLFGDSTTLPSRASNNTIKNSEFQMRETAILTKSLVHEVRFEYRKDYSQTNPLTNGQAINVIGSFNSGGGQNISLTNNKTAEFSNLLMYSGSKWTVKAGFTGVDHLNHSSVQSNFLGTYTFASLADFVNNNPLQFTQTFGNPALYITQLELAGFVQSDWRVTNKFNLMMGGRYEAQTNNGYRRGFDPRLGFAYQLSKTMAIRGGLGTFRQRLDSSIVESMERLDGTRQTQLVIMNPSYQPNCEASATCNPLLSGTGQVIPTPPPTVRVFSPNLATPYTENWSLSLEKTLPGGLGLTFSWDHQRGEHLYRSRDINAPLPGSGLIPDPTRGIVYQLEASGVSKSNNYTISFREQMRNRFALQMFGNYTLGFQNNDTDGWTSTPVNSYDMHSEWGRSGNDFRHRIFTGTNFRLPLNLSITTQVNWSSSNPYTFTTGHDDNGDGIINDRPTDTALCTFLAGRPLQGLNCAHPTGTIISRNTGIGAGFFNSQFNIQKTVNLKRRESDSGGRA
ncbi:MAG TPA: carboxypeptidase regulatory-like domain-containing protein, partial [Terriglobia bacterium]|nr:carboxypeptidase regulatory-like domain-containing protein [Terriglobia bacterium]